MGTNRKQPFGYKMEQGRVVIDTGEASWVKHMFEQYNLGVSIRSLTNLMRNSAVPYDGGKPWNINMVARILADERYIGQRGYPAIVDDKTFRTAMEKKSKKAPAVQKTEAQKLLRRKCDCRITPYIEHEVLHLLNALAGKPERIIMPEPSNAPNQRLDKLKSELDEILAWLPVDETQAREKAIEIAAAMYEAIDPREYETRRMRKVFEKETFREELDASLIEQTIAAVLVDGNGRVGIKLKNDQIIERGA